MSSLPPSSTSKSSDPPRVLIVGLGIAGPLLALLLQKKGYAPIILEKVPALSDAGASMTLFPNGLKAISSISPLLSSRITALSLALATFQDLRHDGEVIGGTDLPSTVRARWGQPACGVRRTELNLLLRDGAVESGIDVREGWKVVGMTHREDGGGHVTAVSATGEEETGVLLVGCDGIHSATRSLVLRSHGVVSDGDGDDGGRDGGGGGGARDAKLTFTGLLQTAGMSPTPEGLRGVSGMRNWYGPNAHVIAYPVSGDPHLTSWAVTSRSEVPEMETWKSLSATGLAAYKRELLAAFEGWDENVREMIGRAEKVIRYGLFDRPLLPRGFWVGKEGRSVLIGDAAHPTSPHLGQGGNQAAEDAWWLASLLPDVSKGEKVDGVVLRGALERFAEVREVRTGVLVRGARAVGDRRVVGEEECEARDGELRRGWEDEKAVEERWRGLLKEPFLV